MLLLIAFHKLHLQFFSHAIVNVRDKILISVAGAEAGGLKKKIKKRPGFPSMSVSQMMVQRERPLNDFKVIYGAATFWMITTGVAPKSCKLK